MSLLSSSLRSVLKKQMAAKKISQKQMSTHLSVSLATFKRWLAQGDMPFSAVIAIAEKLQLNLADLEKLLERGEIRRKTLSSKQENFVATHPRSAFIFLQIFLGLEEREIQRQLKITKTEYLEHLRKLVAADLVYLNGRGQAMPLVRGPFRWQKNGAFSRTYARPALNALFGALARETPDLGLTDEKLSFPYLRIFEMYLSNSNRIAFASELGKILEIFYERSRMDRESANILDLMPVSGLLSVVNMNLWKSVQWDQSSGHRHE